MGRNWSEGEAYRFGHNGQEKSKEVGESNYTAEFWEYDSQTIRRFNLDPKPNPAISDYATFALNPILFSDVKGDIPFPIIPILIGMGIGLTADVVVQYFMNDEFELSSTVVSAISGGLTAGVSVFIIQGAKISTSIAFRLFVMELLINTGDSMGKQVFNSKGNGGIKLDKTLSDVIVATLASVVIPGLGVCVSPFISYWSRGAGLRSLSSIEQRLAIRHSISNDKNYTGAAINKYVGTKSTNAITQKITENVGQNLSDQFRESLTSKQDNLTPRKKEVFAPKKEKKSGTSLQPFTFVSPYTFKKPEKPIPFKND